MAQKKLTLKQREFVIRYLEPEGSAFGNATEAVMQTYNVKRRVIAAVMAKQLKKKPHVSSVIEEKARELLRIENVW